MHGRQSIRKGVWHIGGRKRQRGGPFPLGLVASLAGPILGEVAKPIFKTILGRGIKRRGKGELKEDGEKKCNIKKEDSTSANNSTKWKIFHVKMGENKQKTTANKYKSSQK